MTVKAKAGGEDTRVLPMVMLRVPEGRAATPFVEPGPFTATFTGSLNLAKRSRLVFSFEGNGKARLTVGDEVLLEVDGDLSTKQNERKRLNKGAHPFVLEYSSPAKGDAAIRLYWDDRGVPREPVPSSAFVHKPGNAAAKTADTLRRGRELFAQHRCAACHEPDTAFADSAMPELTMDAPSLAGIGDRLHEGWIAKWVIQPTAMRPTATMPALFGHASVKDAVAAGDTRPWDVAAYLGSLSGNAVPAPKGDVKRGGKLFDQLGCIACHTSPDKDIGDDKHARIPLRFVKGKWKPGALAEFLREPGKHYKWVRMPDFGLTKQEADDLAALLLLHSVEPSAVAGAPKGNVAKGKAAVASMGCMNCHSGPDKTTLAAPKLSAIIGKNWDDAGCGAPAAKRGKTAAQYSFSDADLSALHAFGASDGKSLGRRSLAEFADRQLKTLNCVSCHSYGDGGNTWGAVEDESKHLVQPGTEKPHLDQSRPDLTWIGEKLNSQWLDELFKGEVDVKPRPWLPARMPAFKSRAGMLATGFAEAHGLAPSKGDTANKDAKLSDDGSKLLGMNGGFACIVCHAVGDKKALAPFESQGLNLMTANERLREEFYMRWMRDPPRITPSTKMPKYAAEDGTTPMTLLDGNADAQFNAIWHYLKAGRKAVPPK
jgi:cytochrome c2